MTDSPEETQTEETQTEGLPEAVVGETTHTTGETAAEPLNALQVRYLIEGHKSIAKAAETRGRRDVVIFHRLTCRALAMLVERMNHA